MKTYFYQDTNNADMKFVEDEFVNEVKKHNRNRLNGLMQFFLLGMFGTRFSMKYLMEYRYRRSFQASLQYLQELDADLIFNTHFSTLYLSCVARSRGMIDSEIMTYCPDPILGKQWDSRGDSFILSSAVGQKKAQKQYKFKNRQIYNIPFLLRSEVKDFRKDKRYYRQCLGLPLNNFTIMLADGAYGAGKLESTVCELMKSEQNLTIIAVCGKNEQLYRKFRNMKVPDHIHFAPFGFTDKTLMIAACCDLFMGKAGASSLAEPIYFGAPAIVTFLATKIEKWICANYLEGGCVVLQKNVQKAARMAEEFARDPDLLKPYQKACQKYATDKGPEILADMIWDRLQKYPTK